MLSARFLATLAALALAPATPPAITAFIDAASEDERVASAALADIDRAGWKDTYTPLFIDLARRLPGARGSSRSGDSAAPLEGDERGRPTFDRPSRGFPAREDRGSPIRRRLLAYLEKRTGQRFGDELDRWRTWMWTLPDDPHPDYAAFKGMVYGQIDPRMREFFPSGVRSTIRLDEIDWGGVPVNGIPPLRHPTFVTAANATYLKDSNVVFGLVVNGEAKAYPKRILAWHELATDRIGGVEMTIVYCTLCGTVIPFESGAGGRTFRFGTSGLLYRSNKLMFDEETGSLWSTFEGAPVVGQLVGAGLALASHPIVTTTWREWRVEHPETLVLSTDTGYVRDYTEGAAYRDYFSTDRLMFQVSQIDRRLPNKAEVLVFRLPGRTGSDRPVPVAIDSGLLRKHPVYSFVVGDRRLVVVTSRGGANRPYEADAEFADQPANATIVDITGCRWRPTETALVLESDPQRRLPRVSAQRAFWFGWYAQFPETMLIK